MFFDEDPFDRFCRVVTAFMILAARMTEITVWSMFQRLTILGRYYVRVCWRRAHFWCISWYRRYICTLLMIIGLMQVPTWTEIEAYRLQMSARSGQDIPRPPQLEEGLKQEHQQQH